MMLMDKTQSSANSETTSLASSIARYRMENGRTYHSYKDGCKWESLRSPAFDAAVLVF